jgi:hypothetical protein
MGFVGGFVETQQVGSPDRCKSSAIAVGPLSSALFHVKQYGVQRPGSVNGWRKIAYV